MEQNKFAQVKCDIEPYLFEAGLDPDMLQSNKKLLVDGLIIYQVRDKRRLELDDLAIGKFMYYGKLVLPS